jgi:hypothetical protein
MKRIASVSILFLVIFSCSKKNDLLTIDCSYYLDQPSPLICSNSICQSDTCSTYFGIWKELFLTKNQMTEDYFDNHVTICNTAIYKYANQGIQFELAYKFKIDWFETKFEEGFMIWLFPSYLQANPTINLPDSVLLSKDQISANINNAFFADLLHTISPINHLNYSSRQEAVNVIAHAAGVNNMCSSALYIQYENVDSPAIGHPVLTTSGAMNWNENSCVSGIMDLSTDYYNVEKNPCAIYFCFTRGTKIIQDRNHTKSIEKIQREDTILSFNLETKKTEKDIVVQIDSVKHNDIVRISFNDLTENENTFDHPYYVKNKGWCSFRPSQTLRNYNLVTKQLAIGDTCFKYKNNQLTEVQIKNMTEKAGAVMTYNISRLEKNKTYFANGILVSDEQN